jgi:hypothetical protein
MSPHIAIDIALEGLEEPDCPPRNEVLVENVIVRSFMNLLITAEEFHHYCLRLRQICQRRGRVAA